MQLSAARVFVRDIAAARRFYADALGLALKLDGTADGFCVFRIGPADLVVEMVAADAPADDQALVGRFTGLSFAVADALASYRALQERGVSFSAAPQRQPWGGVLATLLDPSGNELQICQYPGAG